jgi:hypothetical protein
MNVVSEMNQNRDAGNQTKVQEIRNEVDVADEKNTSVIRLRR